MWRPPCLAIRLAAANVGAETLQLAVSILAAGFAVHITIPEKVGRLVGAVFVSHNIKSTFAK